jgi:very-short-patch-repair endonuclease
MEMPVKKGREWNDMDDNIIKELFSDKETESLIPLLSVERTKQAICLRASKLGVKKSKQLLTKTTKKKQHILHTMTHKQAKEWLYAKHWKEEKTMKEIAGIVGISRKNSCYWFDRLDVKRRGISEDNKRRYNLMTEESIKKQTIQAREKLSIIFADEELKSKHMQAIMKNRKESETKIELLIKDVLISLGLKFEQQKLLGPWQADFYLPDFNLIIECDGDYWHNIPEVKKRDKCKNHWYWRNGYSYIRLKEKEILKDAKKCFVDKIKKYSPETYSVIE